MKREIIPPKKKVLTLTIYRVFMAFVLLLILLLVSGSLYSVIRKPDSGPLFSISAKNGGRGKTTAVRDSTEGSTAIFTGIGRLRIPVASTNTIIVVSVSFPYPADDRPFAEELASCVGDFRSIATGYFSSLSAENVARLNEEAAKTEILKRYNNLLRLGKIQTLYFTDFTVLE